MIRLFANAAYDFIRWRRWAYALTAALIIPGFALFLVHGLNYSIEFTGGTLIQVQTPQPVGAATLRGALDAAGIRDAEIQEFGDPLDYVVRARLRPTGGLAEGSTEATAAAVDAALSPRSKAPPAACLGSVWVTGQARSTTSLTSALARGRPAATSSPPPHLRR